MVANRFLVYFSLNLAVNFRSKMALTLGIPSPKEY